MHVASLLNLAFGFAYVTTVDEIQTQLSHKEKEEGIALTATRTSAVIGVTSERRAQGSF
jgi:hypothetical protein